MRPAWLLLAGDLELISSNPSCLFFNPSVFRRVGGSGSKACCGLEPLLRVSLTVCPQTAPPSSAGDSNRLEK